MNPSEAARRLLRSSFIDIGGPNVTYYDLTPQERAAVGTAEEFRELVNWVYPDTTHEHSKGLRLGSAESRESLKNAIKHSSNHRVLVDTIELSKLVTEVLAHHESLSMDSANDRETLRAALVEVLGVQLG